MADRLKIKVFITKSGKFRAEIKEGKRSEYYQVTIGGEMWKNGKGREFEDVIMEKCRFLVKKINENLYKLLRHGVEVKRTLVPPDVLSGH